MRRSLLFAILFAALVVILVRPLLAGSLTASVEQLQISQGDTFELVISLAGGDSLEPPNVASLGKDFEILDRGKRSRLITAGGRPVEVTEWLLMLAPRRAGRLTIPSFRISGETSAPIELDVAPSSGDVTGPSGDAPLTVQLDLGGTSPFFVQGDVPLTIRVFDRVGATDVIAAPILAEGASISEAGFQRTYLRTFNRQRYRVFERRYVLRPQRAGTITIDPVALNAVLPGAPQAGAQDQARLLGRAPTLGLGGMFAGARRVSVRSNALELTVLPRPAGVEGWFLPARAVALTRTWSAPLGDAQVGVALTRTVRLEARGAGPNQLPSLAVPEVDGVRQYADDAQAQPTLIDGAAGAVLETRVSVVPTRAGSLTLPAISIGWWNIATQRQEVATLPAETFTVAPAGARTAPVPAPRAVAAQADRAGGAPGVASPRPQAPSAWPTRDVLAIAGVVVLLLAAVLFGARRGRGAAGRVPQPPPSAGRAAVHVHRDGTKSPRARASAGAGRVVTPAKTGTQDAPAAARTLDAACRGSDAGGAHRAYLAWRRSLGPSDLATAGKPASEEMARALRDLSQHLYAGAPGEWDGKAFRKAFAAEQHALKRGGTRASASRLAPLYPGAR